MATYGTAPLGFLPFTGYTNTLAAGSANAGASAGAVQYNGITQGDNIIAQAVRTGGMNAAEFRVMYALLGAAVGGTATKTKAQVAHVTGAPGGAVPIETITLVNRVTTAADLTMFQALLNRTVFPATYAPDLSGNGGGGKGAW